VWSTQFQAQPDVPPLVWTVPAGTNSLEDFGWGAQLLPEKVAGKLTSRIGLLPTTQDKVVVPGMLGVNKESSVHNASFR
jgi:hypothetical protein